MCFRPIDFWYDNFLEIFLIVDFIEEAKLKKVKVTQLCLTLCSPMDYIVHVILQARILEWVAFSFSRGSSQPRDQTQVSCIAGRLFTSWTPREAQEEAEGKEIYFNIIIVFSLVA